MPITPRLASRLSWCQGRMRADAQTTPRPRRGREPIAAADAPRRATPDRQARRATRVRIAAPPPPGAPLAKSGALASGERGVVRCSAMALLEVTAHQASGLPSRTTGWTWYSRWRSALTPRYPPWRGVQVSVGVGPLSANGPTAGPDLSGCAGNRWKALQKITRRSHAPIPSDGQKQPLSRRYGPVPPAGFETVGCDCGRSALTLQNIL